MPHEVIGFVIGCMVIAFVVYIIGLMIYNFAQALFPNDDKKYLYYEYVGEPGAVSPVTREHMEFTSLEAAKRHWCNRYRVVTGLRYPHQNELLKHSVSCSHSVGGDRTLEGQLVQLNLKEVK